MFDCVFIVKEAKSSFTKKIKNTYFILSTYTGIYSYYLKKKH